MPKSIPDRVAPWQLTQSGQQVCGQVPLAQMPRLVLVLPNTEGEAKVSLAFSCDEIGRCYVHGRIKARPQLICQRCLQPMEWPLEIQVRLVLTMNESGINGWCDGYELWIVEKEATASLWNLVEDEMLLALPIAARHPVDKCSAGEENKEKGERDSLAERRSNPFYALKSLSKN